MPGAAKGMTTPFHTIVSYDPSKRFRERGHFLLCSKYGLSSETSTNHMMDIKTYMSIYRIGHYLIVYTVNLFFTFTI